LASSASDLRAQLRNGGGPAPPPLDSLLAQDPLRDVQAGSLGGGGGDDDTAGTRTGGPLGTPVNHRPRGLRRPREHRPPRGVSRCATMLGPVATDRWSAGSSSAESLR